MDPGRRGVTTAGVAVTAGREAVEDTAATAVAKAADKAADKAVTAVATVVVAMVEVTAAVMAADQAGSAAVAGRKTIGPAVPAREVRARRTSGRASDPPMPPAAGIGRKAVAPRAPAKAGASAKVGAPAKAGDEWATNATRGMAEAAILITAGAAADAEPVGGAETSPACRDQGRARRAGSATAEPREKHSGASSETNRRRAVRCGG
jgi:hypothetical protein